MDKTNPHPQAPPPPGFVPPPPYSAAPQTHQPENNHAPPQGQQTVVIVQNAGFGQNPQSMECPYCHAYIVTSTEPKATTMTHIAFLLCCLLGCFCCAPFVYCTDSCLAKEHYCSNCKRFLGQSN